MVVSHARGKTKPSGGKKKSARGKKLSHKGRIPTLTKIGELKRKTIRTKGGHSKRVTLSTEVVNLFNGTKHEKAKILTVLESPANRHFTRRNILTKGTIINTDKGKARITSRPGQNGSVDAVSVK
ncbi:30S ribosomal protein S8e [Candidatus Woesearchaeota archaeon]|nr:MAG: 30S ribosomal protein S8e [Candidatus Woesearchaeota archaeon]